VRGPADKSNLKYGDLRQAIEFRRILSDGVFVATQMDGEWGGLICKNLCKN
jgi:hypothetical protein